MMFTHKNLMTVCCAAVLAFGLAACGSSGDDVKVMDKVMDKKPTTAVVPVEMPPTDDEIAAKTKAAATKATEIGKEADEMGEDDAGLGGSEAPDPGVDGAYILSIERDRDGTTTVEISLANAMDDAAEFMPGDDLDGGRTMLVRTMPANEDGEVVQEVVIVKTDIDPPTATLFGVVHELNSDEDGVTSTDDAADDAVAINFGDVDLDSGTEAHAVFLANMMSSAFAPPGQGSSSITHTFLAADDDDTNMDGDQSREAAMVAGYYDGAMGTYTCTGDEDCTVDVNGKGELTAATGGWIFTPADGEKVYVADAEYLHYGFWLKNTTKDGATTYNEVETFAGSSIDPSGDVGEVEGSATYEGGAVGVYVRNVFDSEGEIDTATSGHFNADASLTAIFGEPTSLAADLHNSVTGTIDNFVLQHGEENSWSVALKGDITENPGSVVGGTANGGGAEGSFSATFHGDVTAVDDMDDETTDVRPLPSSVVGEFDANFSNGSVTGGFGARK